MPVTLESFQPFDPEAFLKSLLKNPVRDRVASVKS
jgi:hypothetical protein